MDKRQRYLFLDTETTGLKPYDNDVIEVGAIVVEEDENYEPREIAVYHGKWPKGYGVVDLKALEVNKRLVSEVNVPQDDIGREMRQTQVNQFAQFLIDNVDKDTFIVGINIKFDLDFLTALLSQYSLSAARLELFRNAIDIQQVARFMHDKGIFELPNFRGVTLSNMLLGTDLKDNKHSAVADARMAKDIYFKMRELL